MACVNDPHQFFALELNSRKMLVNWEFRQAEFSLSRVAFAPDGRSLLSAGDAGTLAVASDIVEPRFRRSAGGDAKHALGVI